MLSITFSQISECYVDQNAPQSWSRYPTFKAIPKYNNHPRISINKSFSRGFSNFSFQQVDKKTVLKEVRKLNLNKAV